MVVGDPGILLEIFVVLPAAVVGLDGKDSDVVGTFGTVCKADFPTAPYGFEGFGGDDVYDFPGVLDSGFKVFGCFRIGFVLHSRILPVHITAHASFCMIEEQEYFPNEFCIVAGMRDKDIILLTFFPECIFRTPQVFILVSEFFNSSFC